MSHALRESKDLLVRRWGEMGGYWGISRTMAEIHALLFVTGQPLCTDDVMERLHVSRGAASMNLRALVDWGLVRREHKFADRKEYFRADTDPWRMFETIMRERRRREFEPILSTIDRCRELVADLRDSDQTTGGATRETARRVDGATVAGTRETGRRVDRAAIVEARETTRRGDEARVGQGRQTGRPVDEATAEEAREFYRRLDELRTFLTTMGTLFDAVLHFGREGVSQFAEVLTQTAASPVDTATRGDGGSDKSAATSGQRSPSETTTTRRQRGSGKAAAVVGDRRRHKRTRKSR